MTSRTGSGCIAVMLVIVLLACVTNDARGQAPIDHVLRHVSVDSGSRDNATDAPAVVFSHLVEVEGAPWLRLMFDRAELPHGSLVLVTNLLDGDWMPLTAKTMSEWQNTTAYFNGSRLKVELIAGAHTTSNRIVMSRAMAGNVCPDVPRPGDPTADVCSATDPRIRAIRTDIARLLNVRIPLPPAPGDLPTNPLRAGICTGWITDAPVAGTTNYVMLSAGHCFAPYGSSLNPVFPDPGHPGTRMTVAQFEEIPDTLLTCQVQHPLVRKQFAVMQNLVRYQDDALCDRRDWAAFVCYPNPQTGNTVFDEQQSFIPRDTGPVNVGLNVAALGYGAAGPGPSFCSCVENSAASAKSYTQKIDPRISRVVTAAPSGINWLILHNAAICGGDSGGPLLRTVGGGAIGINTAAGCIGTQPETCTVHITFGPLVAAINQLAAGVTAPQNDTCVFPSQIGTGTYALSTVGSTPDGPAHDGACSFLTADNRTPDVWFRYTSVSNSPTTISLCDSSFSCALAVYSEGCPVAAASLVACNRNSCPGGTRPQLTVPLAAGTSYLIRVAGIDGAVGTGYLSIVSPPPNDACADAIVLTDGEEVAFNNANASTDGSITDCVMFKDVWYRYTAARPFTSFIACMSLFDNSMAVYDAAAGCPPAGLPIACDPDAVWGTGCLSGLTNKQARIDLPTQPGRTYLIRIGEHQNAVLPADWGRLTVQSPPAPENNNCVDRITIDTSDPNTSVELFDNAGASTDFASVPPGCPMEHDVWYRYVSPGIFNTVVETCTSTFDTKLAVYRGDACPLTNLVACNDNSNWCGQGSRRSQVYFRTRNQEAFTIRVGGAELYQFGEGRLVVRRYEIVCLCDWNFDGILNSQDFFDYVNGFFGANGDFNLDGHTNSQDFFDMLQCFFARPEGCL